MTTLTTILLSLVAGLLGLLIVVLGWIGNKMYLRLTEISSDIHALETALHGRVNGLDRRITRVEARAAPNLQEANANGGI